MRLPDRDNAWRSSDRRFVSRTLSWCLVAVRVVCLCRAVFATIRPIPGPVDVSRCLCPDDVGGGGDESHENAGLGSELPSPFTFTLTQLIVGIPPQATRHRRRAVSHNSSPWHSGIFPIRDMEFTDVQPVPASSFDQVEPPHSGPAAAEVCAAAGRLDAAIFGFCSSGRVEPLRGTVQAPTNGGSWTEPGSCHTQSAQQGAR